MAVLVGLSTFAVRVLTFEVGNDDYLHMASAQQVLLGDAPVVDFIDPGEPLFYYVSAAAQRLIGTNMLSEVLLDVSGLAVAAGFAYLLAARLSGSALAALATTIVAVLLVPRLYAYPKLLLYPVGLWVIWRYADAPRLARLLTVALTTAVAFLFRHDHGAYLGLSMGLMVILVHVTDGWSVVIRHLATFTAFCLLLLAPFFLYLSVNGGIRPYFKNMMETARGEYQRTVGEWPTFSPRLAAPRVSVTWASTIDTTTRTAIAAQYGLVAPAERGDGEWDYDLVDRSANNLASMVRDGRITATSGFHRERLTLLSPVTEPNALAWFYYSTFALPLVALLVAAADRWRRRPGGMLHEDRRLIVTSALATLMNVYLMRSASESAVGDVSAITCVVAAWLLARAWRTPRVTIAWASGALAALLCLGVSVFLATRGNGGFAMSRLVELIRYEGARGVSAKLDAARRLRAPFDTAVTKYVSACTSPSDRLLVTWYAPEIHYGSGRGFAAGRPYFLASFAPSAEAHAFSLRRVTRERVPIVITNDRYERDFEAPFPLLAAYVNEHYRRVGHVGPPEDGVLVMADRRITPRSTYGDTNLPCYR